MRLVLGLVHETCFVCAGRVEVSLTTRGPASLSVFLRV